MIRTTITKGFTLVETIVASAILCGSVLTVSAITTRSLTGTRINRQYETAMLLIDRQLSMIDYVGIDEFISIGQTEGTFDEPFSDYQWSVATEYMDIDSLYLVTISVGWIINNRPYRVTVDTMFDGVSQYTSTGTETGTTATQ
jgi:prepilin-type N-terminal cleavage/methylation domain-containing protein